MPPHPAPFRRVTPAATALVLLAAAGGASAAPGLPPKPGCVGLPTQPCSSPRESEAGSRGLSHAILLRGDAAQTAADLAVAQDRAARADASVDDLKRELAPGHLTDPMPDTDRAFGLASVRADYADAQRRAAGYRATLGDQHPTLLATEQLMAGLRAQLLDGTRRALASAEREAADARADIAAAERRLAAPPAPHPDATPARNRPDEARAADVTGSIAPPARPSAARAASPLSLPPAAAESPAPDRPAVAEPRAPRPERRPLRTLAMAAAALGLAALVAAWAVLRLLRPRRAAPAPARRVEPDLAAKIPAPAPQPAAEPAPPRPAPAEAVPVLQRLALPRSAVAAAASTEGAGVAELHATLRVAFGEAAARMTVLVAAAAGLPGRDADALALALALTAAAAGRRPLLMETRAAGRLRGGLVPAGAAPMLIEVGGTARTLYRLGPAGAPVALLPSDAGEAEAAAAAGVRPGTARLRGLDAFDTVVVLGDDASALAASADLILLAAPAGTSPAVLAEAALPLRRAGRPCGAVLIEPPPVAEPARAGPPARRRLAPETASAARLGLRGSIEPARRRVGG